MFFSTVAMMRQSVCWPIQNRSKETEKSKPKTISVGEKKICKVELRMHWFEGLTLILMKMWRKLVNRSIARYKLSKNFWWMEWTWLGIYLEVDKCFYLKWSSQLVWWKKQLPTYYPISKKKKTAYKRPQEKYSSPPWKGMCTISGRILWGLFWGVITMKSLT